MMETEIFIFNYNGQQFIERCLRSCLAQSVKCPITVIDNASTDHSMVIASNYNSDIQTIINPKNYHIASAQQQAMELATADFVAFCHVDCFPEKDWIKKMLTVMEVEHAGAVEPEIYHPRAEGQVLHGEVDNNFKPVFTECKKYPNVISTCATLYRAGIVEKYFEPSLLHYGDEVYASEVIKRAGYKLVHAKNIMVEHYGSYSGLTTLKWKMLARGNRYRMKVWFGKPYPNPPPETWKPILEKEKASTNSA